MGQILSSSLTLLNQKFRELDYVDDAGVFDKTPFDSAIDIRTIQELPNVPEGAVMVDVVNELIVSQPANVPVNASHEISNAVRNISQLYKHLLQTTLATPTATINLKDSFEVEAI